MLSQLCNALSHPVRIQLIQILSTSSTCLYREVIEVGSLSQATVLKHLRSLKQAGFIQGEVDGPHRCYWLNTDMLDTFKRMVNQL